MKSKTIFVSILLSLAAVFGSSVNAATTITVNRSFDTTADDGFCSLREAIVAANSDTASGVTAGECAAGSGNDTIEFDITSNEGAGPHTITPTTALPNITETLTINGYTETGAVANTAVAPAPFNGTLMIELDGTSVPAAEGLILDADSIEIRGLVINRFDDGIYIGMSDNSIVAGNYIGTDTTGLLDLGNASNGIEAPPFEASDSLRVGGTAAADRNIFGGNDGSAIGVNANHNNWTYLGNFVGLGADGTTTIPNASPGGSGAFSIDQNSGHTVGGTATGSTNVFSGNNADGIAPFDSDDITIQGNYVGTDYTGTVAIGNGAGPNTGINIGGTSSNGLIGGTTAAARNIISGNTDTGINVFQTSSNITITGNYIGTDVTGTVALANALGGIAVYNDVTDVIIGGTTSSEANLIANSPFGIATINNANDSAFLGNSFVNNTIAIDLETDGVTANDAGDVDSGSNDILNTPLWTSISESGGNTTIGYEADLPAGSYRTEFYANNGATYIGSHTFAHTGSGTETFSASVSGTGYINLSLTATEIDATNPSGFGATSEMGTSATNSVSFQVVTTSADTTADDGLCSLREAIIAANTNTASGTTTGECREGGATDTIEFDITNLEGAGPHTISPTSALPTITDDGLTINGYTETGAVENTNPMTGAFNGTIMIEIDGSGAGGGVSGITSSVNDLTIRGLAIGGFDSHGMNVSGDNLVFAGNFIGTNSGGTAANANNLYGISIWDSAADDAQIGGLNAADRNIISGNGDRGVSLFGDGHTVVGNFFGLDVTGLAEIPNCSSADGANHGSLTLDTATNTTVGGSTTAARNILTGCAGGGIAMYGFGGTVSGTTVQGNYIGTDINGDEIVGGGGGLAGIIMAGSVDNNLIGGTTTAQSNKIHNNGAGLFLLDFAGLFTPLNNSIIGNSIYNNDGNFITTDDLAINLLVDPNGDGAPPFSEDGPNPNDATDVDTGANDYLNYPVINSTSAATGVLTVDFDIDVDGTAPNGYRIEFFANTASDASGYGEGEFYLGSYDIAGDVTGEVANIVIQPNTLTTGTYDISATATEIDNSTDGFGATSEFALNLTGQSIIQPLDNDGDGVIDSLEDTGPNGGDGNGDGTLDSLQGSVATTTDASGNSFITLELDPSGSCDQITNFASSSEATIGVVDTQHDYPLGLNTFSISCPDTVSGTIFYHATNSLSSYTYRKYGPTTPGDANTNQWYTTNLFSYGTESVGGNTVATANFTLTDGAFGDDTGDDDVIIDDNGPAQASLAATGGNVYQVLSLSLTLIILSVVLIKTNTFRLAS